MAIRDELCLRAPLGHAGIVALECVDEEIVYGRQLPAVTERALHGAVGRSVLSKMCLRSSS